tara:strand:- start:5431 stop:5652 length:222 start_codon:yes stop_codon:yes gene_type:complete
MSYHEFRNETGEAFGSFEVFHHYKDSFSVLPDEFDYSTGWYWRAGFPGCLPDGEPSGPFETEQEAIKDATDYI